MTARHPTIIGLVVFPILASGFGACADDDDSLTARYYDQLRRRGMFTLAEGHAELRLADPLLSPSRRTDLVIELSRTLVAHALSAGDDQRTELWNKAASVLAEEAAVVGDSSQKVVLEVYGALIPAARSEDLVFDVEASPFEEPPRDALDRVSSDALRKLSQVEQSLVNRIRPLENRKKTSPGVSLHELQRLLSLVRYKMGMVLQAKARLKAPGSQERHSDLVDADERFRKVLSSGVDEWHPNAKFGLAVNNRLRDEFERALEMLDQLERDSKFSAAGSNDALRLERARILLQTRQPAAAADELRQMRSGRERLPGEFWLLQIQAYSAMRREAVQRSADGIVSEIKEHVQTALNEVDRQVGGPWSRRCRAVWTAAESAERYGLRLAALLSKAQGEYVSGRVDSAIAAYSSAVELAHEDGKADVEVEAGYTLAGILARQGRWDEAANRCRQIVTAYPNHSRSAEIDFFGLYALGRWIDAEPSEERRSTYLKGLDDHVRRFADSPTASEAEYLRGRLLESQGAVSEALAAYQRVKAGHARADAASSASSRCLVAWLLQQREKNKRDADLERRALEVISALLKSLPEKPSTWSDDQAELAYQAAKVFLLIEPPRFAEALRRLDQLDEATRPPTDGSERTDLRAELGRRSGPLRLIALAGQGRPQEAERLLATLEHAGATELLAVVEELSQIEIQSPPPARHSLHEMQLAAAETMNRRREELTREQQRRLDLALAKSYLATSQPTKAIGVYDRLLNEAPKDLELARHIGSLLSGREELGCRTLARTCWQRVESAYKQGSPAWLEARSRVIESCVNLGELEQARKLMKVTKLLYPQLGGDEMRRRYAELEATLK